MTGTYYGTTSASTLANPPVVIAQPMMGGLGNAPFLQGSKLWMWQSTNYSTDIEAGGTPIITDGLALGMKTGDVMISVVSVSTSDIIPFLQLSVITSVTTAGALISTNVIHATTA